MKKTISVILACLLIASLAITGFASDRTDSCPELGNVDSSAGVSVSDARLILRAAINLEAFDDVLIAKSDLDADGKITVSDARLALRIAIKLDKAPAHKLGGNACVICGEDFGDPVPAPITDKNEYNKLNSTKYVIKGSMTDASGAVTPMLIARDGDRMYMESEMEGTKIGMLVRDGKLYMVTADHKNSLEFTKAVRNAMELSDAEFAEMMDSSNYELDAPAFENGVKSVVIENGKAYTVFTFKEEDGGKMVVKMDGDKLISTVTYDKNGRLTGSTVFESISDNVPSSYFDLPSNPLNRYSTATGMMTFMLKLFV